MRCNPSDRTNRDAWLRQLPSLWHTLGIYISRIFNVFAIWLVAISCAISVAQTQTKNVELQLKASDIIDGVPDLISFVFVNHGRYEVRVPPVSPCVGKYSGRLILHLRFLPAVAGGNGVGGGCAGGLDHMPPILDQVKSWRRLAPGESFITTYKRAELFASQQAAGDYDFWGEYRPPTLSAGERNALEHAGVTFLREPLTSGHLRFKRRR